MRVRREPGSASDDESNFAARRLVAWITALGGLVFIAMAEGALADPWRLSASAGATATYNRYFGPNQPSDGFVACLTASLAIQSGQSGRLRLNGTVGASHRSVTDVKEQIQWQILRQREEDGKKKLVAELRAKNLKEYNPEVLTGIDVAPPDGIIVPRKRPGQIAPSSSK